MKRCPAVLSFFAGTICAAGVISGFSTGHYFFASVDLVFAGVNFLSGYATTQVTNTPVQPQEIIFNHASPNQHP